MNKERHDQAIEVMKMIQDDLVKDAQALDGKPFSAAVVAENFGIVMAAIHTCAKTIQLILEGEI
jgi:hypothetical protein